MLLYTLSIPGCASWNGKWSGEGKLYAIVKKYSKKWEEKILKGKESAYYSYNFGDGWIAGIEVKRIDSKDTRKIRKNSRGFCGYDWMIDDIEMYGDILTTEEKQRRNHEKD